jgi:hypothetical protein
LMASGFCRPHMSLSRICSMACKMLAFHPKRRQPY